MSGAQLKVISTDPAPQKPALRNLLKALVKHGASDLHIKAGRPPMYRVNGKLVPAKMAVLTTEHAKLLAWEILGPKHLEKFEKHSQVDLSFQIEEMGRFRANVYMQRGSVAAVIRLIPLTIPSLESLGMPSVLKELSLKKRGLILVTGATGAGKSTTLAAMINHMNEHSHSHIITIEDPIEFAFRDQKSSICQREIGTDANTMHEALTGSLRQDPDTIVIGEMRTPDTIETALTAAETGHLVLSTLHTSDVRGTIDRILDVFPAEAKNHVRLQLSNCLVAVVSQRLVPRADGEGRVAACEILMKSPMVETIIARNELDKLSEVMSNSAAYYKMQTLNQALEALVEKGIVSAEDAILSSNVPDDLRMRLLGFKKEEGF